MSLYNTLPALGNEEGEKRQATSKKTRASRTDTGLSSSLVGSSSSGLRKSTRSLPGIFSLI